MVMEDLHQEVPQPMPLIIGGQHLAKWLNFQNIDGEETNLQIRDQIVDTLYEGDYVRLKSLNLSYDVPTDLFGNIGINQFKVYLDMNNIWTWTKADNLPFDPDQAIDGIYNTMTPLSKTTSLGVTIGF